MFNSTAVKLFQTIPEGIERYDGLREVLHALLLFGDIDYGDVPQNCLLRECTGGGIYEY